MQYLDFTFSDPASNLALDEILLEEAESNLRGETLRIWESLTYFVVLGISSHYKDEVNVSACERDGISVLRRKSGGATVLQGPGCLNFALILQTSEKSGIRSDTQKVMKKNCEAANKWGLHGKIEIQGISDLTWNAKKFSGNAMRRGRNYQLFHGTFLYNFNLEKISEYLGHPCREPEYRQKRKHIDFLNNIPVERHQIITSLREIWGAQKVRSFPDKGMVQKLAQSTYAQDSWNLKY